MERNNRGVMIFAIVVLGLMGLCALLLGAVALGAVTLPKVDPGQRLRRG